MAKRNMRVVSVFLLLVIVLTGAEAFQNLLPKIDFLGEIPKVDIFGSPSTKQKKGGAVALEDRLIQAIEGQDERLSNSEEIASLVMKLEDSGESLERPAVAPEIYGRWRLMHTTNDDTSSPIQRKAVDTSKFNIYQDIVVSEENKLIVSQVVKFSEAAELRVDAVASTSDYPVPELTERKSTGKVLGLNILGVSVVGQEALPDPDRPDSRIDFVFDEGNFDFGPLKVPYPVPFRLPILRDWVKGWIDVTYLSNRVRISRGNKGTTFVLVKEED
mmetsp:Transcript_6390/g.11101  ORF Transcript_6390/g.11101 Transcript_6390/m.11101 type:complete len:273 (-) Transcript_6390:1060-1878(-)